MKRIILLFLLVFLGGYCLRAQLEVREDSFKRVEGFLNINTDKMYDDNDKPYAVLKIRTENINNRQRRELSFSGDARTFFEVEIPRGRGVAVYQLLRQFHQDFASRFEHDGVLVSIRHAAERRI